MVKKKCCYILFFVFIYVSSYANIDSLRRNIESNLPDSVKMNALLDLCWKYNSAEPNLAINYANKALYLAIKNNDKYRQAESYSAIGVVNYYKSEYAIALQYFRKALNIRTRIRDEIGIATSFSNLALIYDLKGDYSKAIIYNIKALRIREKLNDRSGIAKSLANIGLIYFKQDKSYYKKALEYYFKALDITIKENDNKAMGALLNKIGSVYYEIAKLEKNHVKKDSLLNKALGYFDKALIIRADIKDVKGKAITLSNIGNIYGERDDFDKALANYLKALNIHKEYGDKSGLINVLFNIAYLKTKQGKLDEAIERYKMSLQYALETDEKEWLIQNYKELSQLYSKSEQYAEAYKLLLKYTQLKDTIFSLKSSNQIAEMQAQYDIDNKEKEIELLKKDNEIANLSLKRNRELFLIIALLVALILMTLISLVIFNRIAHKNKEMAIIKSALEEKNVLIKEIHHRVKNNLQLINSLMNLQFQDIDDQKLNSKIDTLKGRVWTMALLYDCLFKDEQLNKIDFKKFATNLANSINKQSSININFNNKIQKQFIDINIAVPLALVLNELIDNAIKHAFIGKKTNSPMILIELFEDNSKLHLKVTDNGVGIDEEKYIFREGLGIFLIKSLIEEQTEGTVEINSENGTIVHIAI